MCVYLAVDWNALETFEIKIEKMSKYAREIDEHERQEDKYLSQERKNRTESKRTTEFDEYA